VVAQVYDVLSTVVVANATSMDNPANGPCEQGQATGVEVYQGSYSAANLSAAKALLLYDPGLTYTCPEVFTFTYTFSPDSDVAAVQADQGPKNTTGPVNETSTLQGYWVGSGQSYTLRTFPPGTYTVVAFDAWGQKALGYFQVVPQGTFSSPPFASPASRSFQLVQASVASAGLAAAVNATFRSELPDATSVTVVGTAYPAQTGNPYGFPNEVVCCPMVRSYSQSGYSTVSKEVEAGDSGSQLSSVLLFPSLNGSYLVKLYIASFNGSLLSPVSSVFLQVIGGKATGGQAGAGASFFDSDNGLLYVADSGVDAVSVVNGSTSRVVATVSLPDMIGDLTFYLYDPGNHELYVGAQNSPEIFAIDTSTNFIVGELVTSESDQSLQSMVYDPANGKIFGIDFVDSIVAVINGTTNTIVANITGMSGVYSGILDPKTNELLIQDYEGATYNATTYAINADTDRIVEAVPTSAILFFYDPDDGLLYGHSGPDVVALNATTFEQVGPSHGYLGRFVLYDQFNKDLYFYNGPEMNSVGGNLTAFSTVTDSVVATIPAPGLAEALVEEQPSFVYDPANGDVYATELTNPQNGTAGLLVVSGSSNAVVSQTFPPNMPLNDIALDPKDGMLYGSYGPGSSTIFGLNLASGAVTTITLGTAGAYGLAP
jgi:YVTN family beta-propeller protein